MDCIIWEAKVNAEVSTWGHGEATEPWPQALSPRPIGPVEPLRPRYVDHGPLFIPNGVANAKNNLNFGRFNAVMEQNAVSICCVYI